MVQQLPAGFTRDKPINTLPAGFVRDKPQAQVSPVFDTSVFDKDEELNRLNKDLTDVISLEQFPLPSSGVGALSRTEVGDKILRRKAQLLGFSDEGAPANVRKFESSGVDAEETVRNLLKREFGDNVQVKRIEQLDNQLAFLNPNTNEWSLVNPIGLDVGDITSLRGGAIALGTEAVGAIVGGRVAGPSGLVGGGVGGAAVGEYLRLLDGKNAGAHNLSQTDMIIEGLKSAGIAVGGGLLGAGITKIVRFLNNGKLLEAASEIDALLGDAGPDTLIAGREAAVAAEAATGVERTVVGQATLGAQKTGQETVPAILGGAEKQVLASEGGQDLVQQQLRSEAKIAGAERQTLAGETAGADVQSALTRDLTEIEKRASLREGQAVKEVGEILDGGQDFQRIVGEEVQEIWDRGRSAISRKFKEEYNLIAAEAIREGVVFNLSGLSVIAINLLKEANVDLFKSFAPDDIIALKALAGKKNLDGVDYEVFQRGLSDLNTEIRAIQAGTSPRRDLSQLIRLRDEMQRAKDIAFNDHPELRGMLDEVNTALTSLKTGVDGGIIGRVIKKNEFGNLEIVGEDVIEDLVSSSSKAKTLRAALDDPDMAFLNEGSLDKIREGVHDFYLDSVIVDGAIDASAHRKFMKKFGNGIRNLLGEDDIAKFNDAADSVKMISTLRKEQKNIIKQINQSLGVDVEKLTPKELVRKIWNTKDPEKIGNALSILKSSPKELEAFKGAIRNEIRRASSLNGSLNNKKFTKYITEHSKEIEQVFGKNYTKELEALRDSLTLVRPGAVVKPSDLTDKGISLLSATLRVFFAPLSARGRAFTAGKLAVSKSDQKAFAEILSDPDRFVMLMNELKKAKTVDTIARILGQFGITGANLPRLEQ